MLFIRHGSARKNAAEAWKSDRICPADGTAREPWPGLPDPEAVAARPPIGQAFAQIVADLPKFCATRRDPVRLQC